MYIQVKLKDFPCDPIIGGSSGLSGQIDDDQFVEITVEEDSEGQPDRKEEQGYIYSYLLQVSSSRSEKKLTVQPGSCSTFPKCFKVAIYGTHKIALGLTHFLITPLPQKKKTNQTKNP